MQIEEVRFASEGAELHGRWIVAEGQGHRPAIVMSHGFTAVADQIMPQAEAFARAGFAVLLYDNYGFGRSGGEPRQEADPVKQVRGFHDAVSFARAQRQADPARIGLWGSSLSGGNALLATALDPRVACVVAQAPFIAGWALMASRADGAELLGQVIADREAQAAGAPPVEIAVTSADRATPCVLPGSVAHAYFAKAGPHWRNRVTLASMAKLRAHEPGWWIDRIAPRPLLMIVAEDDRVTPTADAMEAFSRAGSPKKLLTVPGGHFVPYDVAFEACVDAAIDWFATHLDR